MTVWRPILARAAVLWVPLAAAVTGLSVLVYTAVHGDLRTGADDPQIQVAQEAASSLNGGAAPAAVLPGSTVEMASSLEVYVIVFDRTGLPLASSATLHGDPPPFPVSVFDSVAPDRQDRITWAPEPDVRSAVVVQRWNGGYVVVGRSLRIVEERERSLELLVAAGWAGTLTLTALTAVLVGVFHPLTGRPSPPGGGGDGGDGGDGPPAAGPSRNGRRARRALHRHAPRRASDALRCVPA